MKIGRSGGKPDEESSMGQRKEEEAGRQSISQLWRANTLPRTRLGDFCEAMVAEQLLQTGYADVIPTITIRLVSNSDNYIEVPEPIVQNMCTMMASKYRSTLSIGKSVCFFSNN